MYDDIATLITKAVTINTAGDAVETVSAQKNVFCRVSSASFKEKDAAVARGTSADLTLTLADREDYDGQLFLNFNGAEYEIIDTYYDYKSRELRMVVHKWQRQ